MAEAPGVGARPYHLRVAPPDACAGRSLLVHRRKKMMASGAADLATATANANGAPATCYGAP